MNRLHRSMFGLALLSASAVIHAQDSAIKLTAFPTVSVADGRSSTTITAEVRQSNGRPVPDGTHVVFNTTLGTFRDNIATTSSGLARAVLISGGIPGMAKITVSALESTSNPSSIDFEFVGDRSLLSTAQEFIEIVASSYMQYTADSRVVAAAGSKRGVSVRYKDYFIICDDLQINTTTQELRARNAKVKYRGVEREYGELYLKLNVRKGYGTTIVPTYKPTTLSFVGRYPVGLTEKADGKFEVTKPERKLGFAMIRGNDIEPMSGANMDILFKFEDLGSSPSTINAKKAVIFPGRSIQFQKAEIVVAGRTIMRMPLYQLNVAQQTSTMLTDNLLNVNNGSLNVNYPYYLTLKPGLTSLFRFRTGESFGRGINANRGAFIDYELNWNKGDQMDGGLTFSGMGRSDWSLNVRQYLRIDDKSTAFATIDTPSGRSILGAANYQRQFEGFQFNTNMNMSQSIRGLAQTSRDVSLVVEKDPIKVGKLPVRLYLGLSANNNYNSFVGAQQSTYGLRLRAQSSALALSKKTSLTTTFSAAQMAGNRNVLPISLNGNATLSHRFTENITSLVFYDYTQDGFNDRVIGRHRVSSQVYMQNGRFSTSVFGSKSLDVNRYSLFADASFRVSPLWRVAYQYTYDRFANTSFLDYNYLLSYRVGWREVGLTWSLRSKRIGFMLLGASFN